jgi:hypothetical protein
MSDQAPPIVLTLCETDRMAMLEAALEYAINRVDGLHYVIEGFPLLNDPKLTEARKLLPAVKWSWVQKRD